MSNIQNAIHYTMRPAGSQSRHRARRPSKAALAALLMLASAAGAETEPMGYADFDVEQPRPHGGAAVMAADFGFSENNPDNAAAINKALAHCRSIGADRLELAPGTYRCHGPEGIAMDGLEDLVLDGKGALLVFFRKHSKDWDAADGGPVGDGVNLFINRCRRVRVENLGMDWDWQRAPLGFLAKCAARHIDGRDNESYVDLELVGWEKHPLHPNPVPVQTVQPMAADGLSGRLDGTGARCYFGQQPGHFGSRNEWLSPTRIRLWPFVPQPDRPQDPGAAKRFSPGQNRSACGAFDEGGLYAISHRYYGMGGVYILSGECVTLRDFTIRSCFGTAVCIDGTQKFTHLDRFRLEAPFPRPVTSTSDAIHVSRSGGFIKLTGCRISRHNDDALNFHDGTAIARAEGPRTLRAVNNGGTGSLSATPGDVIELRQEDYSVTGWTGKIVKMSGGSIVFDRDLPRQTGLFFVLFNRKYATGDILVRDCEFSGAPWGRCVVAAPNVTFERCAFERMNGSPLRFQTSYTYNVWCEGTGCTNIVVRNCAFSNCAARTLVNGKSAILYTGVRIPSSKGWPEKGIVPIRDARLNAEVEARLAQGPAADVKPACRDIVSGILVEDCAFLNPRSLVWYAENGDNLVFRRNAVEFDGNAPYELLPDAGERVMATAPH